MSGGKEQNHEHNVRRDEKKNLTVNRKEWRLEKKRGILTCTHFIVIKSIVTFTHLLESSGTRGP